MKNFPYLPVMLAAVSFNMGVAAEAVNHPPTAPGAAANAPSRLRFVPKPHAGNAASSSELHPFPEAESKREAVQAWSGVGDSFPVREKGGKRRFEVAVVAGN